MGKPPYVFSYLRLPSQIRADSNGLLRGYFSLKGYYSFGVSVADSAGKSADRFYTLNIQPVVLNKKSYRDIQDRFLA